MHRKHLIVWLSFFCFRVSVADYLYKLEDEKSTYRQFNISGAINPIKVPPGTASIIRSHVVTNLDVSQLKNFLKIIIRYSQISTLPTGLKNLPNLNQISLKEIRIYLY